MLTNRFYGKSMMVLISVLVIASFSGCATTTAPPPPEVSFDGLQIVHDSKADLAYIHPDADFSIYKRILLMPVEVSFNKRWKRDYQMPGSMLGVPSHEWERIRRAVSEEFAAVFKEVLEEEGGYTIVDETAEDVLLIRPALSDLEANALDLDTPSMTRVYVAEATKQNGTLSLEVFDSLTGDILARAVDSQAVRQYGAWEYSPVSRVENVNLARKMFRIWATGLRDRLDEIHGK